MESLECFSTLVEEAGADTAEAVQQAGAVNLDGRPVPISAVAADAPVPSTHHLGSHPTAVRGGVLKHTPWCQILRERPTALRLRSNPLLRAQEACLSSTCLSLPHLPLALAPQALPSSVMLAPISVFSPLLKTSLPTYFMQPSFLSLSTVGLGSG